MAKQRHHITRAAADEPGPDDSGREVGWYQHPDRPREHRFWDGSAWSDWKVPQPRDGTDDPTHGADAGRDTGRR